MGCDIHMHAFQLLGGHAHCIDGRVYETGRWGEPLGFRYRRTYQGRNYMLFAALAGVRNEWSIDPIAEPRGLPPWLGTLGDLGALEERSDSEYDFGDHSFSWLTLGEVCEWKGWEQKIEDSRLLDPVAFAEFERGGEENVTSWCKGTSGPQFYYPGDVEKFKAEKAEFKHIWVPAHVELETQCKTFVDLCKWDLKYLAQREDLTDIVLVFGFDS